MIPRRMVFCDFDGTITTEETFVGMLKQFSPESYDAVAEQVMDGRMSLREGVRQLVEAIPTDRFQDMQAYISDQDPRPGFIEFLDFLNRRDIPICGRFRGDPGTGENVSDTLWRPGIRYARGGVVLGRNPAEATLVL